METRSIFATIFAIALIGVGNDICNNFDEGAATSAVMQAVMGTEPSLYRINFNTGTSLFNIVNDAVKDLCPSNASALSGE